MLCPLRTCLAVAATIPVAWTPAAAQTADSSLLTSGSRVRVSTTDGALTRQHAEVISAGPGTLTISYRRDGGRDTVSLAPEAISAIDLGRGRRSHVAEGVVIGGLLGALVGAATYSEPRGCSTNCLFAFDFDLGPEMAMIGGGGLGAIVGGLIGLVARTEKWKPLEPGAAGLATRIVIDSPRSGGLRVGLTASLPALRR